MWKALQRRRKFMQGKAVQNQLNLLQFDGYYQQEGQHPLTGQRAANFRLLSN